MINPLNKTEYSFRYVYGKIKDIVSMSSDSAVVMADRFTTFGHIPFHKLCKKNNKKPILGVELAFVDDATLKSRQNANLVTLLAKNKSGLHKIYELVTKSTKQKYYYNRLSKEELRAIPEKDVVIVFKEYNIAKYLSGRQSTFFAVTPVTNFNDIIHSEFPLVAASDNLYHLPKDEPLYQIILGNGQWENRSHPGHVLEMNEWLSECNFIPLRKKNECLTNLQVIQDSIESFDFPQAKLPKHTEKRSLKQLCIEGAKERKCNLDDVIYKERLERELKLIHEKDYDDYFYLTWDLVNWAKQHMLVGPARGSSAGSLVCYLLFITDVDPIPFNLIFERFIDVNRFDKPDIDIDFQDTKRDMLIGYLKEKYGHDCVAKLGTVSKYKPKSILTEIAKVLGIPVWEMNDLKNAIPERSGGDARANNCIEDTFSDLEIGKQFLEKYPNLIYSKDIESHNRHFGQHAAGILVSDSPINNYCSIDFSTDGCMLDKKDAEVVDLLKMDCLGLRTLSVIQDGLNLIKKDRNWLLEYPFDDNKAFAVINERKFSGIFQFEGYALINVAKQIVIGKFEDVSAIGALARPGPLIAGGTNKYITFKNDPSKTRYLPACEEYTKETFGVVAYQEQLMQISRGVGHLSWADTSDLRRAASKSLGDEFFEKYKGKFIKGAIEKSKLKSEEAEEVWSNICTMGCLSGDTIIKNPFPNQLGKNEITLKELCDNNGYIRAIDTSKYHCLKKQQIHCVNEDGKIRPKRLVDVFESGIKKTFEVKLDTGESIRATLNHKFLLDGDEWLPLGLLSEGDRIATMGKTRKGTKHKPFLGSGSGAHNKWDGEFIKYNKQLKKMQLSIKKCQICKNGKYEETHHKDGNRKNNDNSNLIALCRKCHKKIHRKIDGLICIPHKIGKDIALSEISFIGNPKKEMTYDVAMPSPNHNFVANNIIVHNSWCFNKAHSISYGLISYWCMVLKAHWPMEFALATLKNAKGEEQVINVLKELVKEGFEYEPFNRESSKQDWSIQDNRLIGGFINIKGVGVRKAQTFIKKRKGNLELTVAEKRMLYNAETPYDNIFEFKDKFTPFYENWELFFKEKPLLIEDITEGEECRFLAKTIATSLRDLNEEILIKKRDGKVITDGCVSFLDLKFSDDGDNVQGRISAELFEKFGRKIAEQDKVGSYYLIFGWCCRDFKYIIVKSIKKITPEEVLVKIKKVGEG